MNNTDTRPPRTIAELAREALNVQDACNLSGVVLAWGRAIHDLRIALGDKLKGTDHLNRHVINQLWASKVHDLCGMGLSDLDAFHTAYETCQALAG